MIELEGGARLLKQWSLNNRVVIDNFFPGTRVEFSKKYDCKDSALPVLAYEDGDHVVADIPNILMQEPGWIRVAVLPSADDAESAPEIKDFKVAKAEKPEDYVYTETKTMSYQALDKRIEDLEKNGGNGTVKSVNGVSPDEDGNVTIELDSISNPEKAEVGQTIVVEKLDEKGKPVKWKAADFPVNYTLPVAGEALGGVYADPATEEDTQPVRIGEDGKLYTAPGGGGNGANNASGGIPVVKMSDYTTITEEKIFVGWYETFYYADFKPFSLPDGAYFLLQDIPQIKSGEYQLRMRDNDGNDIPQRATWIGDFETYLASDLRNASIMRVVKSTYASDVSVDMEIEYGKGYDIFEYRAGDEQPYKFKVHRYVEATE